MDWRKDCHPKKWLPVISGLFLLLLVCCGPKEEKEAPLNEVLTASSQAMILGDWYPVDSVPLNLNGYSFMTDNLCRNHLGFYEYIDPVNGPVLSRPDTWNIHPDSSRQAPGYAWIDNVIRCYGHQTVYEIRNDRLKIFDPVRQDWVEQRMEFASADTLVLINNTGYVRETYIRKNDSVTDGKRMFDELILYFPASLYSDEVFLSVKHTDMLYNRSFRRSLLSKGIITKGTYQQIESRFRQANVITPLTIYNFTRDTLQTMDKRIPRISFVINGKISTLYDPVSQVPASDREFYWAYFSALFLQDYIHLIPDDWVYTYEHSIFYGIWWQDTPLEFQRKDSTIIRLFPDEDFYLRTLLLEAKPVTRSFHPQYLLGVSGKEKKDIQTDGRYYKYIFEEEEDAEPQTQAYDIDLIFHDDYENPYRKTYDIGLNFIEEYGLDQIGNR